MSKLLGRRDSGRNFSTIGIFACLVLVNAAAWVWTWISFTNRPELFGAALLAYVLGLRHAFDPDHIAAIDNVVRKLMQDGRPARLTGCYFALGHSSIVVVASFLIARTALSFDLRELTGVNLIRSVASSMFLIAIGVANIVVLKSTWRTFVRVRFYGDSAEHGMDDLQSQSAVTKLFPAGVSFGLQIMAHVSRRHRLRDRIRYRHRNRFVRDFGDPGEPGRLALDDTLVPAPVRGRNDIDGYC
jgi:high-affinity nickel permease